MALIDYIGILFPAASKKQVGNAIITFVNYGTMFNAHVIDFKFRQKLMAEEGYRNDVYKDSRGKLTVGIGHLVTLMDNLSFGEKISDEKVEEFYKKDAGKALYAALEQATELGISDEDFIVSLAEVNYQLGTGWRTIFPNTWTAMKRGDFERAISNLHQSEWKKQTPKRVENFVAALKEIS